MAYELLGNLGESTLNGAINNSVTTLTVTSATPFPAAVTGTSQFRVIVGTEIMIVTNVSGTTFTVTRGAESTTAASHASGDAITHVITAGTLSAMFGGGTAGQVLGKTASADYAQAWTSLGAGIFGDGSDGTVSISGSTTLTRDMFYDVLTVTGTGVLNTGGYRVFCRTSCTVNASGKIHADGGNASGPASGGFGAIGTLYRSQSGGSSPIGAGNAGSAVTTAMGGAGGAGGAGAGGAGGAAGTATAPASNLGTARTLPFAILGWVLGSNTGTGASSALIEGGGGGGGGGGNGATQGGGGGSGGGVLVLAARTLVNNGTISANGGNGSNNNGAGSNLGGGGGGGGGYVSVVYNTKSGSGTITATAGTGSAGNGTGVNGSNGSAGLVVELVNQ